MVKLDQKGMLSPMQLLIIVGVIIAIGLVGWRVASSQNNNQTSDTALESLEIQGDTSASDDEPVKPVKSEEGTTRENFVTCESTEFGFSFMQPKDWEECASAKRYGLEEAVPAGFGSPIQYTYNSSADIWESRWADGGEEKPTQPTNRSPKIGSKAVSSFATGDGMCGTQVILFVKSDSVIRLELPTVCMEESDTSDSIFEKEEAFVDEIISTIKI